MKILEIKISAICITTSSARLTCFRVSRDNIISDGESTLGKLGTLLAAGLQKLAVYRELQESREAQANPCRNVQRIHSADQSIQQLVNVMSKGNKPKVRCKLMNIRVVQVLRAQNRQG